MFEQSAFQPSVTSGTTVAIPYQQVRVGALPDTATAPERETIPHALDSQQQYLAELHKTISILEDRLTLILTPRPPDGNGKGNAPAMTGVLERLHLHTSGIGHAAQRIADLVNRVQL